MSKDYRYSTYRDGNYVDVPPIEELCLILKDKFMRQDEDNERLRDENMKLKEGIWEKEEIKRLKEENKRLEKESRNGFSITDEEWESIHEWQTKYKNEHGYGNNTKIGIVGGLFTYQFVPTSLGISGVCIAPNGEKFIFRRIG